MKVIVTTVEVLDTSLLCALVHTGVCWDDDWSGLVIQRGYCIVCTRMSVCVCVCVCACTCVCVYVCVCTCVFGLSLLGVMDCK